MSVPDEDLSIRELGRDWSASIVYPDAELVFDSSKPDGMPRKVLDVSRLHSLGWHPTIPLPQGIRSTYEWFLDQPIPSMA